MAYEKAVHNVKESFNWSFIHYMHLEKNLQACDSRIKVLEMRSLKELS